LKAWGGAYLCLAGDKDTGTIDKVWWWRDKTVSTRTGNYSHFMVVPRHAATERRPEFEAVCLRTHLETYYARTLGRDRVDDKLFILTKRAARSISFAGTAAGTVRSDIGWIMDKAGIDARFRPHSLKAASAAAMRARGSTEDDVLRRCNLSSKVYREFYEKIITAPLAPDVPLLQAAISYKPPRLQVSIRGGRSRARGRGRARGGRSRARSSTSSLPRAPAAPASPPRALAVPARSRSPSPEFDFGDDRDWGDWPVGLHCDAVDEFGKWFHAIVKKHRRDTAGVEVKVHFHRFAKRWDRWIPVSSDELTARGTRVQPRLTK